MALKSRGDGRLEPEKDVASPKTGGTSPVDGDGDAADGADKASGKKKSVIESMKSFFSPRSDGAADDADADAHMSIGAPFGFQQLVHVTVDPTSESGFNGLPDTWEKSLVPHPTPNISTAFLQRFDPMSGAL